MSGSITIRRIKLADYIGMHDAFAELSRHALEANPHMAPAAIEAATLLIHPDHIVILGAWRNETLGQDRLAGIWALRRRRDLRTGFSATLCAPLLPLYEVLSTPVLDRDVADKALQALLRHCIASGDLPKTLILPLLPLEGQGFASLNEACRVTRSRLAIVERWQRPMMIPLAGDTAETYLRRALSSSYKKRMQQFRVFQRAGQAGLRRERGAAAATTLDTFLALEATGWKGETGTAIAKLPRDSAYFRRLADLFAAQDGLLIDSLMLDGKAIAMGLLLESAGTRHFLKIAYDETQSRLSPGRALTIAMILSDFAGTPPRVFDSGAGDGVDAGTYVWGERREMGHAVIALGEDRPGLPELAAEARAVLRRLRDRRAKRRVEMDEIRIGIVTVSDRASAGIYADEGGPAIAAYMSRALSGEWTAVARIIPDDRAIIAETLIELCDEQGCCLVVTTGGTGPALRDVTPEATEDVIEKPMPGFGELMRQVSLKKVPTAILSRQTAGIRGASLIVNLPGRPRAIGECLDAVMPAIPYCIDLIGGPFIKTDPKVVEAFRPGQKTA